MSGRNYQDLHAWQEAMDLVEAVYLLTRSFPREELFVLSAQIRRAAVSIPSNIAEGQGRRGANDFARYLTIAHGSLREVETQILIAKRLQYIDEPRTNDALNQAAKVGRLITGLLNSLRDRPDQHGSLT